MRPTEQVNLSSVFARSEETKMALTPVANGNKDNA